MIVYVQGGNRPSSAIIVPFIKSALSAPLCGLYCTKYLDEVPFDGRNFRVMFVDVTSLIVGGSLIPMYIKTTYISNFRDKLAE